MRFPAQALAVGGAVVLLTGCGIDVFLGELPGTRCSAAAACPDGGICLDGRCRPRPDPKPDGGDGGPAPDAGRDGGERDAGPGPLAELSPSPVLDFKRVAYFAGATPPSSQTRALTVTNSSGADATLRLGGLFGARPYATVKALNSSTTAAELEIGVPQSDAGTSPPALAPGESTRLMLKLVPRSVGQKSFEVALISNDPALPRASIEVRAEVVALPPCDLIAAPSPVDFGLVTPPEQRELEVTLSNQGAGPDEVCIISNLELSSSSDPVFSLPAGPLESRELGPRESLRLRVRAWSQGPLPANLVHAVGALRFDISSASPAVTVPLRALVGPGCLLVAPDERHFGTVKLGCASASRGYKVYNVCTAAMVVSAIEVHAPAGQPAGGPGCPGPAPCPEFLLGDLPAIADGGLSLEPGASPLTFTARYRPLDVGPDLGSLAVVAEQGGQQVRYLATVSAAGDGSGLNTDTFVQDIRPRADLLLVVDDSGSMDNQRQALGNNFASFLAYASGVGVDYRIAVTTTDNGVGGEQGRFVTGPAHPEAVLTPTTPDLAAKFLAKVTLGTSTNSVEMVFEPALKALTAPLATGANSGFLREDAALAVVAVTDEPDQSPSPVSYYLDALTNVKGSSRAHLFTVSAVAGFFATPPAGCTADPDDGRLSAMVSATAGVQESICTADWARSLQRLGPTAFGYRTRFGLLAAPDLAGGGALSVTIDAVQVPPVDGRGQKVWSYEPAGNAVVFEPSFTPGPGQALEISYPVSCF